MNKLKMPFRVRLEEDLIEDLNSDEVLNYYGEENPSQLARKLLRDGVNKAKNMGKGKEGSGITFRISS